MTDRSDGDYAPLVRADQYEVNNGDGTVTILEGNPRYCPQEQEHEAHEFAYAYLDQHDNVVRGSYGCFGDPAPWADQSGREEPGE